MSKIVPLESYPLSQQYKSLQGRTTQNRIQVFHLFNDIHDNCSCLCFRGEGKVFTKIHRKARSPHEVSTPFHCSNYMIFPSLYTSENPLKLPQKSQINFLQPSFSGRLVKTPPFSTFHYVGTAGHKHP